MSDLTVFIITYIIFSTLQLVGAATIARVYFTHFKKLIEAVSKDRVPTQIVNNSTSVASKTTNVQNNQASTEDLDVLKELAQFKKTSDDVSVKLNMEEKSSEVDSSSQDALDFLKKKKDQSMKSNIVIDLKECYTSLSKYKKYLEYVFYPKYLTRKGCIDYLPPGVYPVYDVKNCKTFDKNRKIVEFPRPNSGVALELFLIEGNSLQDFHRKLTDFFEDFCNQSKGPVTLIAVRQDIDILKTEDDLDLVYCEIGIAFHED